MSAAATAAELTALDQEYTVCAYAGRDAWFQVLRQEPTSIVWAALGEATTGARGGRPRLHATIQQATRTVNFPLRTSSVIREALQETLANGRRFLWLPLMLTSSSEVHANAVFVDTESKTAVLFEPHGSDAQDARHAPCGFHNFYMSKQYFATFREIAQAALGAAWRVVTPEDYQPPVFGQSVSGVLPTGGDKWCTLWTLLFLERSSRGRRRGSRPSGQEGWRAFVEEVDGMGKAGGLRAFVIAQLRSRRDWMVAPPGE